MNAANKTHSNQETSSAQASRALREPRARLIIVLDRAIVLLMAAIVLTLAWPVSMAFLGQSHAAQAGGYCLNVAQRAPLPQPRPAPQGRT